MLYWIWLTQIKGVGPKRQRSLLESFNTPENIYRASFKELLQCPGIGNSTAKSIIEKRSLEKAKIILDGVNDLNIKLLTLDDPLYPLETNTQAQGSKPPPRKGTGFHPTFVETYKC